MLRLEMGVHTDSVTALAVDPTERWAVTVSDDQTARVWELASGRLLTLLRPPAHRSSGPFYAVAISHDGQRIVVGGKTEERWCGGNAAFVFDRQGRLFRVLQGLRDLIFNIAFTPDDRLLVIGGHMEESISSTGRVSRKLQASRTNLPGA